MVDYSFILRSLVVPLGVSLIVCVLVLGRVYVNQLQPLINQAKAQQLDFEKAVKTAMSAMGTKSGQVRQDGALEKMVAGDLLEQFPEIQVILGLVSPDTAAAIEENPERALRLIERYKDWLPMLSGGVAQKDEIEYDL